jgi:predicted CopG family antitoxin
MLAQTEYVIKEKKKPLREYKQVRMPKEVYDELVKMGTAGNSIGDVVAALIKFWKEYHKRE